MRLAEVPFIGHVLTEDGVRPSSEKVRTVLEMPVPEDKSGARPFVELVQYLAKFMPKLSDMTVPLRKIMKESSSFVRISTQQKAFDSIKMAMTQLPVPNKEPIIPCDRYPRVGRAESVGCGRLFQQLC